MMPVNKWNDVEVIKRVKQKMIDKLELAGEFVEGAAKVLCPVDLGNLRESINHKVNEEELSVKIGTNVEYAPYVELGTSKMAAQPFLRPALLNNKSAIQKIFDL
jgi:HK97 gp10 family phage protein